MAKTQSIVFNVSVISVLAAALVAIPQAVPAQDRTYGIETVVLTGEPAPETGGLNFEWLGGADLNDSGQVVVGGSLQSGSWPDDGLWAGTAGNLTLVARTGDTAPGTAAESFYFFDGALINESGDLSFIASFASGTSNGIWIGQAENMNLLVKQGDAAAGTGGLTFGDFLLMSFDDLGRATFRGYLDGADFNNWTGFWTGAPGHVDLLVQAGDPSLGSSGLPYYDFYQLVSNSSGTLGLLGLLDVPIESTSDENAELLVGTVDGLNLVAEVGDEAPGTSGRLFRYFDSPYASAGSVENLYGPALNAAGKVAFRALIDPIDPTKVPGDDGIWAQSASGLVLVALEGEPAPGTADLPFRKFNHVNFNAAGQVAFDGIVDSGDQNTNHGIWVGQPGSLSLLVREGDPAPGTNGEHFGHLSYGPSLNSAGEVVFVAPLSESSDTGIWAGTLGDLALIARVGEAIEVGPNDFRTIQFLFIFEGEGSEHANSTRFNNAGQLLFAVRFTDGSDGLLLASPIPAEPNQPPIADAGPDQTAQENQTIALDASGSFDPESTVLSFVWSLDGVEVATGPTASVGPLAAGSHTVTLTVTDRSGASASDTLVVTIERVNLPPVADAGPDQAVNYLQMVTLDGAGSSDPDGTIVSHVWSLSGSQIATGPTATVGPFAVGTQTITLTVTDDEGASASDNLVVTVTNAPPVANAGPDQTVSHAAAVALDGSGSSDPEDGALTYVWTLGGSQIATGAAAMVGPFDVGSQSITLTVTDDQGASATDTLVITVTNTPPVANAGPDQTANYTETLALDGSGSSDPEGGALTYIWTLGESQIGTGPNPNVGPLAVGTQVITLTVTDEQGASASDSVTVTVINENPVADAGPDQTVTASWWGRKTVTLDGTASSDPEDGIASYVWTQSGQTVGSGSVVTTTLATGVYTFTLTVTDDLGASSSDDVVVTVNRRSWAWGQ